MEGVDSICGQGNEIPEAVWHGQKKKKKRELKQNKNKSNMRTIGENVNHKGKPKL